MRKAPYKTSFTGGIDKDTDKIALNTEDYLSGQGFHNSIGQAGEGNVITNLLGTRAVLFNQTGTNVTIGAFEDREGESSIYFVFNSNGDHQIRRYYSLTDTIELVMEFDFEWEYDKRISNIDFVDNKLLYWTDSQPRKINVEKSTNNKLREFEIYVAAFPITGIILTINGVSTGLVGTYADINTLSAFIEALSVNAGRYTTEVCNDFIILTFTTIGDNTLTVTNPANTIIAVASNHYSLVSEAIVDAGKYPLPCPPLVALKTDTTITFNNINKELLQFRTRVQYDDFEKSVYGNISDFIVNKCGFFFNYIEIDFTQDWLNNPDRLVLIRSVEIAVREGNTGRFETVTVIPRSELWNDSGVVTSNIYKYYNNTVNTAIADSVSLKQYDVLPVTVLGDKYDMGQVFADSRMMYSKYKKDYSETCTNHNVSLTFSKNDNEPQFDLNGIIRIFNPDFTVGFANRGGSISTETAGDPSLILWGGGVDPTYTNTQGTRFNQYLPEGGFPVYIVGTDNLGISKQAELTLLQESNRVLNLSDVADQNALKDFYIAGNEVFSEFKIRGVGIGKWVIRIASHLCSFGDILGRGSFYDLNNGRAYQQTSTNTRFYNSGNGTYVDPTIPTFGGSNDVDEVKEITIEIDTAGNFTISCYLGILVTGVANSNNEIFLGELLIEDMVDISVDFGITNTGVCGYLFDTEGQQTQSIVQQSPRAELQFISGAGVMKDRFSPYSDHNGYFYGKIGTNIAAVIWFIIESINGQIFHSTNEFFFSGNGTGSDSILKDLYEGSLNIIAALPSQSILAYEVIIPSNNTSVHNDYSTLVKGRVVDLNGLGVGSIKVVIERNGRQEETDSNGNFSILVYGDTIENNNNRVKDLILINSSLDCLLTFPINTWYDELLLITPFLTVYNILSPYESVTLNPLQGTIASIILNRYLKGGGNYEWATVYTDSLTRPTPLEPLNETYIPFITENPNTYGFISPSTNSEGVFIPTLNLVGSPPPQATHMFVYRTQNMFNNDYLQFAVNDVKYVASYDSTTPVIIEADPFSSTANEIWFDLGTSLLNYKDYNANSQKSYTFTKGDKLRVIRTANGELLDSYIDLEIKNQIDGFVITEFLNTLPVFEAGTIIEVYTPKLIADTKLYYKIPYCIEIINGQHFYNGVQITSLELITGDAYRRTRTMPIEQVGTVVEYLEDNSVSDFYESKAEDIGLIGFVDDTSGELNRTNDIPFSGQYLSDTKLNGLNSFDALNVKSTDKRYGAINKLITTNDAEYNSVILVVHEVNTVSIYVRRATFSSVTGTNVVSISEEVLGADRTMLKDFGTSHPESFQKKDGNVWWWDGRRKKFQRYAQNGITPISDIGLKSFTQNFKLRTCVAVFDDYHQEYIPTYENELGTATISDAVLPPVGDHIYTITNFTGTLVDNLYVDTGTQTRPATIVNQTTITIAGAPLSGGSVTLYQKRTLVFSEKKKKWTSDNRPFTPEGYGLIPNKIISFVDGDLFVHDSETRNTFYGVFHSMKIRFVLKGISLSVFTDGQYRSNKKWIAKEILTPVRDGYPNGQKSELGASRFYLYEGRYWFDFLRDINDPVLFDANNPDIALLKGRVLRGDLIEIELENSDNTPVELRYFEVYAFASELTSG